MDEDRWDRVGGLFDQLLAGLDPDSVLASEPDPEVRATALNLWRHHVRADAENYLAEPLEFGVAPVFQPNQVLLDRFRIERMLGAGGMGEVYLAFDQRVDERVALKTIARLLAPSPSIRKRFSAEVQNARRVTHPNICRIHELFEDGETVFFSMEYIDGVSLSEVLNLPVESRQARSIVLQMAEAMRAAHRIGIVHGDLKPANVMVVLPQAAHESPRAVIMDFGLARALNRASSTQDANFSVHAGTLEYMAPELQAGEAPTIRSDIFAFGRVARQLLPKERVWDLCTQALAENRPASLDPVMSRLEPQPTRRYWLAGLALASGAVARYFFWPTQTTTARLANSRILVNGFRSVTATTSGARLARSLVLTALEQSPHLRAIADQDLLPALRQLDPQLALPLAGPVLNSLLTRLNAAFYVDGELRQVGARYSLDVRLMAAAERNPVTATAFHDAPNVILLAQAAARWLRQSAGESRQSLAINPAEVGGYTSEVPEALQKYFDAMDHYAIGEMDMATPLLEEAVRLDPNFAQAHNMLALTYNAVRRYDDAFREIATAMQLVKKLPERERIAIETNYYRMVEDPKKMVDAAKSNLVYHPDEPRYHGVLAHTQLHTGNVAEAVLAYSDALKLAPNDWSIVLMLETALVDSGDYSKALAEFEMARSRGVTNNWIYNGAGTAYMGLERYPEAVQAFTNQPPDPNKTAELQSPAIMEGRLEVAIAAMQEQRANGQTPMERFTANEFLCGLFFVSDRPESARPYVLEMVDLPAFPPMAHNFSCAASWAMRVGDAEALAKASAAAGNILHGWPNAYTTSLAAHVNALEAWRANHLDIAQTRLLQSCGSAFDIWALFDLAEFFTRNQNWELAEVYWQKFEARQGRVIAGGWFPGILVMGWLHRAVVAQARNQRDVALQYSRKVLDHWSRSNPRLSIVQTAEKIHRASKTN